MIRYIFVRDALEMGQLAAEALARTMASGHPVVALPTGRTPEPVYAELVRRYQAGEIDFSRTITFNLDEYVGLAATHPASFRSYMEAHLFQHVNLRPEHIHFFDGTAADLEQECRDYEQAIRQAGGISLGLLGLGPNGHIAFNEPGTPWESRCHLVTLTAATREANAPFFGVPDQMPGQALTMGIATIREMRRIMLLVTGENKAEALAALYRGVPTLDWPVTALIGHPDVTVLVDTATVTLPGGLPRGRVAGEGWK